MADKKLELKCPECGTDVFHITRTVDEGQKIVMCASGNWGLDEPETFDASEDIVKCGSGHQFYVMAAEAYASDIDELRMYFAELEKEKENPSFPNPFSLYYASARVDENHEPNRRAIETSNFIKEIVDKMVVDLISLFNPKVHVAITRLDIMRPVALQVKALHCASVGVGDTGTDEAICAYIENNIIEHCCDETCEKVGLEFYELIH